MSNSCATSYSLSLTEEIPNFVACALVQSRVDYANSLYTGISFVNFNKLKLMQNTLAGIVTVARKRYHIQSSLKRPLATDQLTYPFQGHTVGLFNSPFW